MSAVLLFVVVVGVLASAALVRNHLVFQYRNRLIDALYKAAQEDIDAGDYDWRWRHEAYDAVRYDEMVWKFWRRFDSFYPDRSFTESRHRESA